MWVIARSLGIVLLALLGAIALAASWTMTTAVQLLATTAFIMGGTQHPLVNPNVQEPDVGGNDSYALSEPEFANVYVPTVMGNYIALTGSLRGDSENQADYNRVAVYTPEEFVPVYGSMTFDDSVAVGRANLGNCLRGAPCVAHIYPDGPGTTLDYVVLGYSESAVVASLAKRDLIENPDGAPDDTSYVILANPMRGNGGVLARGIDGLTIPIIGITFYGATPTNTCQTTGGQCYRTVDIAQQYDALGGDLTAEPLNLLALANSIAAYALLHGQVPDVGMDDPRVVEQESYGDTDYYLITAPRLPLLMPLEQIGVPGPILAVADAPMRVMIEATYVREKSPGERVRFRLLHSVNPIEYRGNLAGSIPVGIDDGLQEAGHGRPLGTEDVYRPYGVGGETFEKPQTAAVESVKPSVAPLDRSLSLGGENLRKQDGPEETKAEGTKKAESTPPGTRPRPLRQLVRGPIEFDRPKPAADRPSGDRPFKKMLNALAGQRLKPETKDPDPDPEPAGDQSGDEAA